jgi:hypothetical protein
MRMLRILPEIVDATRTETRHRDPVLGGEDLQRLAAIGFIALVAREPLQRALILALDPGQRLLAVHVLKPDIRIVICNCHRGTGRE